MWVDLRAGYRCNNRCRFCDQGDRRDTLGDAPLDALVAVLARERAHADAVWLAGGEITLRPDLPRLVEAARALGYTRVGLQTNGRILAAPGAAEALRARGLTDAVVALHAATPALHDWLVGAEGAHKQATVGLRRLVAAGVATRVATVLTRSGTAEIGALAALALRLGVEGHRWILARPVGAAEADWRLLVPRLALVRGPVVDAVRLAWDQRREAETVGLPLCVLGEARAAAADRLDAPPAARAFPPGFEEPAALRRHGPPCAGCPARAACPGVPAGYVDRYGWDEIVPPGRVAAPEPPEVVVLPVEAACAVGCPACATREAYAKEGAAWPTEPERTLRQRLVRAAAEGARAVVFAGASPWSHPGLPGAVREARRLGFERVAVWGPIEPVAALPPAAAEKLAGLTAVRAPVLGGVPSPAFAAGRAWLAAHLPACPVETYLPDTPPDTPLYQSAGPRAVWANCQRSTT